MSSFVADDFATLNANLKRIEEERTKANTDIETVYGTPVPPAVCEANGAVYNPLAGGWSYQAPDDYIAMSTYIKQYVEDTGGWDALIARKTEALSWLDDNDFPWFD